VNGIYDVLPGSEFCVRSHLYTKISKPKKTLKTFKTFKKPLKLKT